MEIKSFKLSLRTFLRTYRWRRNDPIPVATLQRPLAACRVALVSSAGLVPPGVEPFDERKRGGDFSHRLIPAETEVQALEEHHRSDAFDHDGIAADRNICFPLDRLRELAARGEIGSVAPQHISLMGSITAPGRLVKMTLPLVTAQLQKDEVDVALLVPV